MVVACPPLGGSGGRRCGCRPRSGSRRGLSRRRLPGGFGPPHWELPCGPRLLDLAWTDFPAGIIAE